MKKYYFLIVLVLILGLALAGCTFLSNIGQAPATEQNGISYLTKNPGSPDLVGLWHFDEGSEATTVADSSGNDNTGYIYGAIPGEAGKFGNALSFDGINDYVLVDDDATLGFGTSDFTVEAWINVKKSALVTYREYGVVNKNSYFQDTPGWGIEVSTWGLDGDFGVICYITNQTSWVSTKCLSVRISSMTADVWHHIAQVRTGTTLRLYFDGELVGMKTHDEIVGDVNNSQPVIIGDHSWGPNFPGLIDEVRIWNRALDEGDIAYNYKNSLRDVKIDIKPDSDPNSINLGSHGVVPVAILGSEVFDAATVNPLTVTLSGADVKVKGHSGNAGSLEDVNGDGYSDLVVQVYTENLDLEIGDVDAFLNAYTYTGLTFLTGKDSIRIVPPK